MGDNDQPKLTQAIQTEQKHSVFQAVRIAPYAHAPTTLEGPLHQYEGCTTILLLRSIE